jgi:hypothetical protein
VRDLVRGLARPEPDAAFRSRLRHEFVTGRFGQRPDRSPARPWFLRPFMLLPAAACALVVLAFAANRGPDWSVRSVSGEGQVVVDGASFEAADRAGLAPALRRGGHVRIQGAVTLDLVAPGVAAVALAPGADAELSPAPNRWWRRGASARLHAGDAYFSTGRAFHGAHLDVVTDDARVRAVGTSFAVLCAPFGTCVCVMEGRVRVGGRDAAPGDGVEVPHGMRRVVHPDQVAETLPILEDSVHRLHRQLSTVGSVLAR